MAFKMKGHTLKRKNSPNKFIGMGLSKMLRDKARELGDTGLGQTISKIAGSGALGLGGMLASKMLGGGGENDQSQRETQGSVQEVPQPTHGDDSALSKKEKESKKEVLEDTTHLLTMTVEVLRLDGIIQQNKKKKSGSDPNPFS